MSVRQILRVQCDGNLLGVQCIEYRVVTVGINLARADMKRQGWVLRTFRDRHIDLCPNCAPVHAQLPPSPSRGGRPKKVAS